jgi:hypothetical protein
MRQETKLLCCHHVYAEYPTPEPEACDTHTRSSSAEIITTFGLLTL